MPYKTALTFTYDCGEFEGNMREAAALSDLASFEERRAEAAKRGKLRGIGLCNCIEVAGGPFLRPAKDLATLRLAEDGTLILRSGSMSVGQGLETTFSPTCRRPLRRGRLNRCAGRAATPTCLPSGKGNGGSGALCIGGSAVSLAMDKVIEKAARIAAELLEAAVVDIEFAERTVHHSRHRPLGFAGRRRAAPRTIPAHIPPGEEGGLVEIGEFTPTAVTFPNGTHVCEVEIDAGNRRDRDRPLQRGGGTWPGAEPDDRRRADPRRRGAGRGSGAGRDDRSRSGIRVRC